MCVLRGSVMCKIQAQHTKVSCFSTYATKMWCAFMLSHIWLCHSTGLLYPWDFPGKNTGVGFHFLLQGILSASPVSPALQADSLLSEPLGRCFVVLSYSKKAFIFLFEYERTPYFHNRSEFLLILMWSLSLCNSNTLVPAFTYGTIQVVLFYFYMTFL